jgi:hypothetical protein
MSAERNVHGLTYTTSALTISGAHRHQLGSGIVVAPNMCHDCVCTCVGGSDHAIRRHIPFRCPLVVPSFATLPDSTQPLGTDDPSCLLLSNSFVLTMSNILSSAPRVAFSRTAHKRLATLVNYALLAHVKSAHTRAPLPIFAVCHAGRTVPKASIVEMLSLVRKTVHHHKRTGTTTRTHLARTGVCSASDFMITSCN